ATDVDKTPRCGEPHVEQGTERLPAGENARLAPSGREFPDRCFDRRGRHVLEGRRLHSAALRDLPASALTIAATMRRGVAGISVSSAPSGKSASLIAFTIAPEGAMAPP